MVIEEEVHRDKFIIFISDVQQYQDTIFSSQGAPS